MAAGRQNTRATCPKDKLEVVFFCTKSYVLWESQVAASFSLSFLLWKAKEWDNIFKINKPA